MAIRYDIDIDDYHASPNVSSHKLKDFFLWGPRYYAARYVVPHQNAGKTALPEKKGDAIVVANSNDKIELSGKEKDAAKKAEKKKQNFIDGQAFEDKLCEPHLFEKRYAIKPYGMTFSTVKGKEFRKQALAEGKQIITEKYYDHMMEMVIAIQENEFACSLLAAARKQPTITCEYPGIPGLQSRPDFFNDSGIPETDMRPYTLDLKTTLILSLLTSGKAIGDNGYHRQAGISYEVLVRNDRRRYEETIAYLLAVEKNNPHRVQVVEMDHDSWIVPGWNWAETQLQRLAGYYERGEWPRVEEEYVKSYAKEWQVNRGYSVDAESEDDEDAADEAA